MSVKVSIVFYSMYGHMYQMAKAVAEGVREVEGAEVALYKVPELIPADVLERSGAQAAQQAFAHIPVMEVNELPEADAIIFGVPTRFGNMPAQMRNFLDQTGGLWASGALIGKVGSAFTAAATQHGGLETTLTSTHLTLLHHGMIIVGIPYSEPLLSKIDEVAGGSPYGASTITGGDGSRWPSEAELAIARTQGHRVAQIALSLKRGSQVAGDR